MHRNLIRVAGLVSASVLGAGLALGGAAVFGDLGSGGTTVVREVAAPSPSSSPVSLSSGAALSVHQIFERTSPGVVQVTSTSKTVSTNPFGSPQTQTQEALGSGFVIDKAGHIVTNYHVVEGARSIEVSFSNSDSLKAKVVGVDPSTDIAVLQVNAHARALTPLELGDSSSVGVGDPVVAIGDPFGYSRTVTSGIVSALQRQIQAPNNYSIDHVIQTDAALNHGNSGGPLLNGRGQVIGVNSQISTGNTGQQGNVGIGFAIPINTVKTVAAQLIKNGRVEHAELGVRVQPLTPAIARLFRLPATHGLLVGSVKQGSGAAAAGLKGSTSQVVVAGVSWPIGGDLIVAADGVRIVGIDRLHDLISRKQPGQTVTLTIYRGTKKLTVNVKLGRQSASPQG